MKRYLNLGILAHVDAGKTTLTERLLHTAGVIDQIGSVAAGTTQTDSLPLEQQRGITIKSAVVSFVVDNITINLIDTPGHPDFIAEVERVQPQTRILMRALKRLRIPTLIFVNKIDRPGARPEDVFADITNKLALASIEMGIVHDAGTKSALFSPFGSAHAPFNTLLAESLADQNDGMLAAFVENKAPSYSELRTELAHQTNRSLAHPVFFGSAILGVGVDALISGIIELLPIGEVTSEQNDGEPVSGVVLFKVERSSNGEKIAYIRMFSGSVRTRERFKIRDEQELRITSIQVFERGSTVQRQSVSEGSIAKIWGLTAIRIGDALGVAPTNQRHRQFAPPTLETAIVPAHNDQKGALHVALTQLAEQDPLINLRQDDVRQELYLSLNGEVQKEVIQQTLANDFDIEVEFNETTTICIERPTGIGTAVETIGKSPNPFLATVGLRIEPAEIDSGVKFQLEIDSKSVPHYIYRSADEFREAMTQTIQEVLQQGLHGWRVTDCVVTMTHSGYSSPGSGSSDFRDLTAPVLMRALKMAGTEVCEPMHRFHMDGPVDMLSPTLNEVARLEAIPTATVSGESTFTLEGEILASRMHKLQMKMMALTRGEGVLEFTFDHYKPVRGTIPIRPRTDNNPLNYKEYLLHVVRRI